MIKTISGVLAIALAGAGLTACADMGGGSPKPDMVMAQSASFTPSAQVLEDQRCNATEQEGLVGKNISTVAPNTAKTARIVPATTRLDQQPFVATRLTVLYDPANNTITDVRCG